MEMKTLQMNFQVRGEELPAHEYHRKKSVNVIKNCTIN